MSAWEPDDLDGLPVDDGADWLPERERHVCARCGECEVPFEPAFCGPCVFAIRAEAQEGMRRLADYLGAWARFDQWDDGDGRGRLAA